MRKIIGVMICLFLITTGFVGISKNVNTREEAKIVRLEGNDFTSLNMVQAKWVFMRSYSNYAPSKMPDFDQRQDSWQKIDAGSNQQIDSTATLDDIIVGNTCIAPGNNGQLDSSASGDDVVKWYYCGPTATANALWYIDSKHEKNDYPDNNQDTCDLVTNYSGISDDHATGNVPKLIEDLAANFLGTSGKCTTNVRDIASGAWNFINNSKLIGQYKVILYDTDDITMDNLTSWMRFSGAIILRLDTPERGHFVTLQAVNSATNQIIISDPDFDASNPAGSHTQHNDASIVSHDTYTINPPNLRVLNYPEDPCMITHAVNIWKLPIIDSIFIYYQSSLNMDGIGLEMFHIVNIEQPTDDCIIYYYLPNGIEYAGGAIVNGIPTEPLMDGDVLKWYLPGMYPGQVYEVEFQITATSPEELELERRVRTWAYAPSINTELYDDDFGILEINDDDPPLIESVYHQIIEDALSVYAEVTDNMKVDQVKAVITDPEQETNEYEMSKSVGDLYKVILDISDWIPGGYTYHVWAKDLAGNEQTSDEYTFYISDELLADAGGPYEGIAGEPVEFYGSAIGGAPPYSYKWDFGDEETSYEQNPQHVYDSEGTYTVTLTVTDATDEDDDDETTATITENNPPNAPNIDGPPKGKPGTNYDYEITMTDPDEDNLMELEVDFGDGEIIKPTPPEPGWTSGSTETVSNSWSNRGTYTIKARVQDEHGEWSDWGTLEVSMPKSKLSTDRPFLMFLQQHPNLFPILTRLLQLLKL